MGLDAAVRCKALPLNAVRARYALERLHVRVDKALVAGSICPLLCVTAAGWVIEERASAHILASGSYAELS